MSRCDLQVHSRFSDRPSEWILRRLGVPESYTAPQEIYRRATTAGMDFVTITDHNTINGCLEIAEHPNVFLSEEVTTHFPDGVRVHVLVWGMNEKQHQEIQSARANIYDLVSYLRQNQLVHGVAHPLFSVDRKLTVDHFEQLVLLFKIFEGINGLRNPLANEVVRLCLTSLTPKKIEELANKHHFEPYGATPWQKILIGGSDDHGGLFVARAWTETPVCKTSQDFLKFLENGQACAKGQNGTIQTFASSIYNTVHHYIRDYLQKRAPLYADLLGKMFERFLAGQNPTVFSLGEKVQFVAESIWTGRVFSVLKTGASIPKELTDFFNQPALKKRIEEVLKQEPTIERRSFVVASEISNYLGYQFFDQMIKQITKGNFLGSMQSASALVPVIVSILPYLVAYNTLFVNRRLLEQAAVSFLPEPPSFLKNSKRAWLTDTLEDVNGVARTICTMTRAACDLGCDLTVITSRSKVAVEGIPLKNFRPVGEFEIPEYQLQKLSFPPVLEMLDYIQREGFTELILSTPGPIGIVGLMAAKMFGLKVSGIYHTDFPQYVKILSDDDQMETLTWNYMQWFYGQMDVIYSNSRYYRELWIQRGIPAERVKILPRGLDQDLFHPKHRRENFWPNYGAKEKVVLYVGRISKEKDLDILPEVEIELRRRGCHVTWAFVGEGPYRKELKEQMPQAIFTGVLTGLELGKAYASADIFVFPSTTDTYGNVVVEAAAAGLPVVVANVGGPAELVKSGVDGITCFPRSARDFAQAIEILLARGQPGKSKAVEQKVFGGWEVAAQKFWEKAS